MVKNLPAMQEMQEMRVQFLGLEDPLEKDMATYPLGVFNFTSHLSRAVYCPSSI